ncbi:MAG: hypothetical protein SGJ09_15270 [Phycisphaerae bacterium]|nr:hypothetical protein [Phycisphaerae bacterium]
MNRHVLRLLVLATPMIVTASALAQNTQGPRSPKLDSAASPAIGYAIMAIMTGVILAISLYPSKRSHSDL